MLLSSSLALLASTVLLGATPALASTYSLHPLYIVPLLTLVLVRCPYRHQQYVPPARAVRPPNAPS
jgi:hypothetical protein